MEIIESSDKKIILIRDDKCWICKKEFNNEFLNRRTYHHAIEKRYKPDKNFKLPICQKCHYIINTEDLKYKKRWDLLTGVFKMEENKLKKELLKLGKNKTN